jgi:hypothetical protein
LNPSFVWISNFVYMCTCHIYCIILDLSISGLLSDTDQHLWKSHSSLILQDTLTPSLKMKIISLNWPCCSLFFEEINKSVPVNTTSSKLRLCSLWKPILWTEFKQNTFNLVECHTKKYVASPYPNYAI